MHVIRPNCRAHFTPRDVEFVMSVLSTREERGALNSLITDAECFDNLLEMDEIYQALLEIPESIDVSHHFYFYVLVRHIMQESGIDSRELSDYVAEVLAEYTQSPETSHSAFDAGPANLCLVDVLAASRNVGDRERFIIMAHAGNAALFFSGLFADRIRSREQRRAAPSISYYEEMGRSSYKEASRYRFARKYHISETLEALADVFHDTRIALNELADRILFMHAAPSPDLGMLGNS